MKTAAPIPIPFRERVRDLRMRFLPGLVFVSVLVTLLVLWRDYSSAPTLVGQVEAIEAKVSCYKPGMLAQLNVNRFQMVKAGDPIGQVLVTDPKILASSLAVIQAEIESLRVGMRPLELQQRTAMDYSQLRIDWMRQRAQLAMAKVNLQLASTDLQRTEQLYKDQIVAQRVYDQAKATEQHYRNEVEELTRLVEEQAKNFGNLPSTNVTDISKISNEPLRAAIAAEESKLHLTEAELSPITLRAPVDGMVNAIYRRAGEAVTAGETIVAVAAQNPVRIVGYIRPPILDEPRLGGRVEVRTRGPHRQAGSAEIVEVGTQFEPVTPALQVPLRLMNADLGLPIGISLPPNLKIRPGELVDLTLLPSRD